jgi:hypothetical protein
MTPIARSSRAWRIRRRTDANSDAVELVRTMRRFAEEHESRIADHRAKYDAGGLGYTVHLDDDEV